jgi:uncharacterized RmlC-like cupin family protein
MNESVINTNFGYQLVWANTDYYNCKILIFDLPGSSTPMHFHKDTTKSWFVNSGRFRIRWIDTDTGNLYEKDLTDGGVFHVPTLMPVSLEALAADSTIAQVSNQDPDLDYFHINPGTGDPDAA